MSHFQKKAVLVLVFLFLLPTHTLAQSLADNCGPQGCPFGTYSGLTPATPGILSPGLTGSSLAMTGPNAVALYQIAGAQQLDMVLYSTGGTVASYNSAFGAWTQGAGGSQPQRIYWDEERQLAFLSGGATLQIDPNSGAVLFFSDTAQGGGREYLGVNIAYSADGSSFRPVAATLTAVVPRGSAWEEHFQATLPDSAQWVRVSLRDYQQLPLYGKNNKTRPATSQIQLGEVAFTGAALLTGGQQAGGTEPAPSPSSSMPPPPPSAPSSSLPPPPDIAGRDTVEDKEDKAEEPDEESEAPEKKPPPSSASISKSSRVPSAKIAAGGRASSAVLDSSGGTSPVEEAPAPQEEAPLETLPQPPNDPKSRGDWQAAVAALCVAGASVLVYRVTRKH